MTDTPRTDAASKYDAVEACNLELQRENEQLRADAERLDHLEKDDNDLFRRNTRITRAAIDAERKEK